MIHEVAAPASFQWEGVPAERAQRIIAHHTMPEQAGEVFTRTKPESGDAFLKANASPLRSNSLLSRR